MQRDEIKFKLNNSELFNFKNKTNLFRTYPTRNIFSIYFDTINLKDFIDSEEGTVPRKKIRLRYYNIKSLNFKENEIIKSFLEIKRTLDISRNKQVIKIIDAFENSIKTAKNFLNRKREPKCAISYNRKYYRSFSGIRITIDNNIKYYKFDKNNKLVIIGFENSNIVEMKIENVSKTKSFESEFLSAYRIRFSKYCQAIRKIKLIDY